MDSLKSYLDQSVSFLQESWAELSKVHFPSPGETIQATVVVVVLTLLMSVWLWMIDLGATWVVRSIIQ
jgi:preprotein translocase subunit SecE